MLSFVIHNSFRKKIFTRNENEHEKITVNLLALQESRKMVKVYDKLLLRTRESYGCILCNTSIVLYNLLTVEQRNIFPVRVIFIFTNDPSTPVNNSA